MKESRKKSYYFYYFILILSIFASKSIFGELTGDNVCPEEERYMVNVTRHFLRNITIRDYEWCLQVPPRCSTYKVQQINDSRTVEEERVKYIKTCCTGYKLSGNGDSCVSEGCPNCVNGFCNKSQNCDCEPGFQGVDCSKECDTGFFGKDCKQECDCGDHGICDKRNGKCYCPQIQTINGLRCEPTCSRDKPDHECKFQCICFPIKEEASLVLESTTDFDASIEYNGDFKDDVEDTDDYNSQELIRNYQMIKNGFQSSKIYVTKPWINLKRSSSFPFSYFTTKNVNKEPKMYGFEITTSSSSTSSTFIPFSTTISSETLSTSVESSSTPLESSSTPLESSSTPLESSSPPLKSSSTPSKSLSTSLIIKNKNRNVFIKSTTEMIPRATKEMNDFKESTTINNNINEFNDFNDFKDINDINSFSNENLIIDSRLFITVLCAVLFSVLVILVAVAFCVLHRLKERKRECEMKIKEKTAQNVHSVSVTARSIFHTPLPEPPTFQNPVFSLPLDSNLQPNAIEVVCNMNFPKNTSSVRQEDFFYDHPPSTGSYRAASIPEPPTPLPEKLTFDPIYDEIPNQKKLQQFQPTSSTISSITPPPSYISEKSTLYMNCNMNTR